jgi:hypothetical protein
MGSEDGHDDHHHFHTRRTVQTVCFNAALRREHVRAYAMLPVLWGTHAIIPMWPSVGYGVGLPAQSFPKALPALDDDFNVVPQMYHRELLSPSRVSATEILTFRRRISRRGVTQDFLHYSHSTRQPHDNHADRTTYPMRRRLYRSPPYQGHFYPLMALASCSLRLGQWARPQLQHGTLVMWPPVGPIAARCRHTLCRHTPYRSCKGHHSNFAGANLILDHGWGLTFPFAIRSGYPSGRVADGP